MKITNTDTEIIEILKAVINLEAKGDYNAMHLAEADLAYLVSQK